MVRQQDMPGMSAKRFVYILLQTGVHVDNGIGLREHRLNFSIGQMRFVIQQIARKRYSFLSWSEVSVHLKEVFGYVREHALVFTTDDIAHAMAHVDTDQCKYGLRRWIAEHWPSVKTHLNAKLCGTAIPSHPIVISDVESDSAGCGEGDDSPSWTCSMDSIAGVAPSDGSDADGSIGVTGVAGVVGVAPSDGSDADGSIGVTGVDGVVGAGVGFGAGDVAGDGIGSQPKHCDAGAGVGVGASGVDGVGAGVVVGACDVAGGGIGSPPKRCRLDSTHEACSSATRLDLVTHDAFTTPPKLGRKRPSRLCGRLDLTNLCGNRRPRLVSRFAHLDQTQLLHRIVKLSEVVHKLKTFKKRAQSGCIKKLGRHIGVWKTPLKHGSGRAIVLVDTDAGPTTNTAVVAAPSTLPMAETMANFMVTPKGKGRERNSYSVRGLMAMALRKNLSTISSRTVGRVTLVDMSRQVVSKAEVTAATSLAFHAQYFHRLMALGAFTVIRTEQDATNSCIWRKNKLMSFLRETITADEAARITMQTLMRKGVDPSIWFTPAVATNNLTGDLLVPSAGSAGDAAALFEKQLRSSGCPSIMDLIELHRGSRCSTDGHTAIMMASDGGPDQTCQKRHWQNQVENVPSLLLFDSRCWFHLYSRQSEGHLQKVEDGVRNYPGMELTWKYYPSLCKISHCSRDLAAPMYKVWGLRFGLSEQQMRARRVVPRPISTRWQTVGNCEEFMLRVNEGNQFSIVLKECLVAKVAKAAKAGKNNEEPKLYEEISAEELHAYSEKMGRWRRDTLLTIEDTIFWRIVQVSARCRSVAEHCSCWLKGPAMHTTRPWLSGLHHAQFVYSKGEQFCDDYMKLLDLHWLTNHGQSDELSDVIARWLTDFAVDLLLWNHADFHRRLVANTKHFPDQLLWFVYSLPDERCTHRQRVATQMTEEKACDSNARKILHAFPLAVAEAMSTGLCSFDLWLFIYLIAVQWKNKTDHIEGCNSFIKRSTNGAPRINLDLLSSRLQLAHNLEQLSGRRTNFTWRHNHNRMSETLHDVMQHVDDADAYLRDDSNRWTEVEPLKMSGLTASQALRVCPSLAPIGEHMLSIGDVQSHELVQCKSWAKTMANNIRKQLRALIDGRKGTFPCSLCIVVGESGDGACFLPTHLGQMLFLKCPFPQITPRAPSAALVRFDLVLQTLYTQVMTSLDLPRNSKKRKMIEAAVNIVAKRIRWTDGVGHVDDHVMITLVPLGLATAAMKVPSSVKRPQKKAVPVPVPVPIENGMARSLEDELEELSDCDGDHVFMEDGVNHQEHAAREVDRLHAQAGGCGGDIGGDEWSVAHAHEECALAEELRAEDPHLASSHQTMHRMKQLQDMEEYVSTYITNVTEGWAGFRKVVSSACLVPGFHGQMSILKHPVYGVQFFHWMTDQVSGRFVKLDRDNRPIWPVSSVSTLIEYSDSTMKVIAPAVGTRCMMIAGPKRPGEQNNRPTINQAFLDLKARCESVLEDGVIAQLHPFCQVCSTQRDEELVSCIMCMTTCHRECTAKLQPEAAEQIRACQRQLLGEWTPATGDIYTMLSVMGTAGTWLCHNCSVLAGCNRC